MKSFFRSIHLYLSLAAGLVIMTCCVTGAILVFEKELQEGLHHQRYFVRTEKIQLPITRLLHAVTEKYPSAKINAIKVYPDPARSVEVSVTMATKENRNVAVNNQDQHGKNGESLQQADGPMGNRKEVLPGRGLAGEKREASAGAGRPTQTVFVNPYNAQIIELYNYRNSFFYKVFALHRWLLGSESSIGKTITGIATLLFVFILLTGVILWWPRNKAILLQRLKIKSNASFKRLNHDFHVVLGFYSAIFLFIFAFTALAWSFKWFNNGIYTVTHSSMTPAITPHSGPASGRKSISYDSAFIAVSSVAVDAQYYTLRTPADSSGVFTATALPAGAHETAADTYYIDQYSGALISTLRFQDKNLGQRIRSTFKPVHVGSIFGLPSKIIAVLVCILGATFPITGTIMWINRLRKKKKKQAGSTKVPALADSMYEVD